MTKTGLFYILPIVAWNAIKIKTNDKTHTFYITIPIIPYPFGEEIPSVSESKSDRKEILTQSIIPANNSFLIKGYDAIDKTKTYFVDGCISSDDEAFDTLQEFFNRKLDEIIKMYESQIKV